MATAKTANAHGMNGTAMNMSVSGTMRVNTPDVAGYVSEDDPSRFESRRGRHYWGD